MSEANTDIQTEVVQIPRSRPDDPPMECYQAFPVGEGPFPGIVVIHEIFGLNDNIRDIAGRFARQGYAALAVDLFSGVSRVTCLMQIFYALMIRPIHNAHIDDLQNALEAFRNQSEVDGERTGVVGFCMGGSYALQLASVQGDLRAASVFYGQNPRPMDAVASACPIVGSYPGKDFTANAARKLQDKLDEFNVPHDIKIYPGTKHSFFNDQGPAFAPVAAHDAWLRMLSFFEEHLL